MVLKQAINDHEFMATKYVFLVFILFKTINISTDTGNTWNSFSKWKWCILSDPIQLFSEDKKCVPKY